MVFETLRKEKSEGEIKLHSKIGSFSIGSSLEIKPLKTKSRCSKSISFDNKIYKNKLISNTNEICGNSSLNYEKPLSGGNFKIEITYPNQFPFKTPSIFSQVELNKDQKIDGLGQVSFSITCPPGLNPKSTSNNIVNTLVTSLNEDRKILNHITLELKRTLAQDSFPVEELTKDDSLFIINEQSYLNEFFRNLDDYNVQYVVEKME